MANSLLLLFVLLFYRVIAVFSLDDWGLVNKYCPIDQPVVTEPLNDYKFYIYRDHPIYERTIQRAFEQFLGGGGGSRRNHESESEFYGEIEIWCEIFKHPQRTWNTEEATLFIVPAFPYLIKEETEAIVQQIKEEPYWLKNQGKDHLVICTHWACNTRLGSLFHDFVLPGYITALERNFKWLDPRLHRVDSDNNWERVLPTVLTNQNHPLCPERIIILPYPPHQGIISCRPKPNQPNHHYFHNVENRRNSMVFFAGTLREKLCGMNEDGSEHSVDGSRGVRASISLEKLFSRYGTSSSLLTPPSSSSSSLKTTIFRNYTFNTMEDLEKELSRRKYNIFMLQSRNHGGRRIGGLEGNSYPNMVRSSYFCLHLRGDTPTSRRFYDAIAAGCLPIIISDNFGSSLPFLLNQEINYSKWITIISQDKFALNPLGEIDSIIDQLFDVVLNGDDEKILVPNKLLLDMQLAMALDVDKLSLCSGTGAVGNQLLQEVFTRIKYRNKLSNPSSSSSNQTNKEDKEEQCYLTNHLKQLELYATERQGGAEAWIDNFKNRYHTDWSWCTEIETTFDDYHHIDQIQDQLGNSLPLNQLIHVS